MSQVRFSGVVILCALAIALGFTPSLLAQGQSDGPFTFNGFEWASKADFMERGRCSTRNISDAEADDLDELFNLFQLRNPSVTGGTVNVYFHERAIRKHLLNLRTRANENASSADRHSRTAERGKRRDRLVRSDPSDSRVPTVRNIDVAGAIPCYFARRVQLS